jgi:DNA adenine methylase
MHYSPLRYPGGKSSLSKFLKDTVEASELKNIIYYELYAGGAGAGLELLFDGTFDKIVLNDVDYHIYAFWYSVLNFNENLVNLINNCTINIDEWQKQKEIYLNPNKYTLLEVGFSTFFLNRSNRSGILHNAGPIGGKQQDGNYTIKARFNKENLIKRISKIDKKTDSIGIHDKEAITYLEEVFSSNSQKNKFIYLDPPYYEQGENLYLNFYKHEDHKKLSSLLKENRDKNWLLTYDNKPEIQEFYKGLRISEYSTRYSLQKKQEAKEILIFSDSLEIPAEFRIYNRSHNLEIQRAL